MAVLAMEKVQILGMKTDLPKILNLLQKKGVMQIEEINEDNGLELQAIEKEDHSVDLTVANTDFAIKLLTPYAAKRPIWAGKPVLTAESALGTVESGFDYENCIKECQKTEEAYVAAQNRLHVLEAEEAVLKNWSKLNFKMDIARTTAHANIFFGEIPPAELEGIKTALKELGELTGLEIIQENERSTSVIIAVSKEYQDKSKQTLAKAKFQEIDLPKLPLTPKERLEQIHEEKTAKSEEIDKQISNLKNLAKHLENLQIVHDVFVWKQENHRTREKLKGTTYSFIVTGWIAKIDLEKLTQELEEISTHSVIHPIKPKENEMPPVLLHNARAVTPFEFVTKLYGFPMASETDPTPFLATFFIVFFGLCLTDAGYGLMLFVIMFLALKFFKLPKESVHLVRLLMWGGLVTIVAGYFFGGYFGLLPEQAPSFMVENGAFKGQLINATAGQGPIIFLVLALTLGVVHVLFGKIVDGWWKCKQKQYLDAVLDSFLWVAFIIAILAFGLVSAGILPPEYQPFTKWAVLGGVALMVLTQGRKQKGILSKFGIGVLSLYGLVSYLGDILSYSRLMALGLGTGIIAFAMNTIAGLAYEMIPYVGIVFAIIVLIIGHTLNLVLSALGAFIHSARLQFVEFFGKFLEGGGTGFKAFKRTCKYIIIT